MRLASEVHEDARRVSTALYMLRAGMVQACALADRLRPDDRAQAYANVGRNAAEFLDVIESWPQTAELDDDISVRRIVARIRADCFALGAGLDDVHPSTPKVARQPHSRRAAWFALAVFGALFLVLGWALGRWI